MKSEELKSRPELNFDEIMRKVRASKREWIDILGSAFRIYALKQFDQGVDLLFANPSDFLKKSMVDFCETELNDRPGALTVHDEIISETNDDAARRIIAGLADSSPAP